MVPIVGISRALEEKIAILDCFNSFNFETCLIFLRQPALIGPVVFSSVTISMYWGALKYDFICENGGHMLLVMFSFVWAIEGTQMDTFEFYLP